MYKCPHCGQPGISKMRKMCLGPARSTTCKACGERVGVPYTSMIASIPFFIAVIASLFIGSWAVKIILWFAGFLLMSVIHIKWVPLEPR